MNEHQSLYLFICFCSSSNCCADRLDLPADQDYHPLRPVGARKRDKSLESDSLETETSATSASLDIFS